MSSTFHVGILSVTFPKIDFFTYMVYANAFHSPRFNLGLEHF